MTDDAFDADAYVFKPRAKRKEKDDSFESHPQSPIPPEERGDFDGLNYFDPNPDYRVTALVETHTDSESVAMDTSTDGEVRYLHVATFHLELRDTDLTLDVYHQEHDDLPTPSVPFRDKTTGQQTYDSSRYMGLTSDTPLDELEKIVVDFSLMYNPFCAFTEAFEYPLPSKENWLNAIIPAGERDYE